MAEGYLAQAAEILAEAERTAQRGVWNLTVRRAQEAVELALKAALRLVGVEVPHVHDVGVFVKDHADKFTAAFREQIDRMAAISHRLRREREASLYGDEQTGAPPQRLYTEEDARAALRDAGFVLANCTELLASVERGSGEANRKSQ
jgi:HEPN domain-containing protein